MEFLDNVNVGDSIWIKSINRFGQEGYYKDVVLRKLKTKIETTTGEFWISSGEWFDNSISLNPNVTKFIIEFTPEIEKYILHEEYNTLIEKMKEMSFNDNKMFKSFINKVNNLYNANKGI